VEVLKKLADRITLIMAQESNNKLFNIFKVVSQLDYWRWNQDVERSNEFVKQVTKGDKFAPRQKILIHWLIYITDRNKNVKNLWKKNSPIIELVENYEEVSKKKDVGAFFDAWEKNTNNQSKGKNKIAAYPADLESIKRTLILLHDYKKDLIRFISEAINKPKEAYPFDYCSRVAFSLFLLSYDNVGSLAKSKGNRETNGESLKESICKAKNILSDRNKFEKEFKNWAKSGQRWRKRIWAALRDYKKGPVAKIFKDGIKDKAYLRKWEEMPLYYLELPGDIWNARFFDRCIRPLIGIEVRGEAPKIIRGLYDELKGKNHELYPEQLDITYDFTSRMCEQNNCCVCPFGLNGAESICIARENQYCPVALVTCGYIVKCNGQADKCIVRNGGKGICEDGELKAR
jgi:hypothetical protein